MKVQQAEAIVGGLSNTSKLPCRSISLPAQACKTGAELVKVPGSVCATCYALDRGMYRFPVVMAALQRRMDQLRHPQWVEAMVVLVKRQPYFRWFDSGDIQGLWHLENIIEVARRTPETKHWLPTKEYTLIKKYSGEIPANLLIRVSSPMIDQYPMKGFTHTSTVHNRSIPQGHSCPAHQQGNQCGGCRACWDPTVSNISYPEH